MNQVFGEYSTSTAFLVNLSKRQAWAILTCGKDRYWLESGQFVSMSRTLQAKGLVERVEGKDRLTRAGRLMRLLLIEAGLTIENTRTVSVVKGTASWNSAFPKVA